MTSITVLEGEGIVLNCSARGEPPPTVAWYFNSILLTDSIRYNITEIVEGVLTAEMSIGSGELYYSGESAGSGSALDIQEFGELVEIHSTLMVTRVNRNDAGNYTCLAKNIHANDSVTAQLIVNGNTLLLPYFTTACHAVSLCTQYLCFFLVAPAIVTPPASQIVLQSENATFSCSATGIPRPVLLWERVGVNGSLFPTENDVLIDEMIGETDIISSLMIVEAQPSDAGLYRCVVFNAINTTSAVATLTVHGK